MRQGRIEPRTGKVHSNCASVATFAKLLKTGIFLDFPNRNKNTHRK